MITNGMTQIEERTMNLIQSACKKIVNDGNVDWNQRRYEIAKDVLGSVLSQTDTNGFHLYVGDDAVDYAVDLADMLVNRLKGLEDVK